MIAADLYRPDEWHDFFVMTGGGAAALTGLVFVALSLNIHVMAEDATHRYRAIGTLAGLTSVFMICGLALMGGQDHRAIGVEWLLLAASATFVYLFGIVQAVRLGGSPVGLRSPRVGAGTALYVAEIIGAALIFAGIRAGLYMAAVAMVTLLGFMISGAWLLIVSVSQHPSSHGSGG